MAQLGYGGIANTFGIRSFSGKVEGVAAGGFVPRHHHQMNYIQRQMRGFRSVILLLLGA